MKTPMGRPNGHPRWDPKQTLGGPQTPSGNSPVASHGPQRGLWGHPWAESRTPPPGPPPPAPLTRMVVMMRVLLAKLSEALMAKVVAFMASVRLEYHTPTWGGGHSTGVGGTAPR